MAFNKLGGVSNPSNIWSSATSSYSGVTGAYTGSISTTVQGVGSVLGEWIDLELPSPIILRSYSIQARNDAQYGQTPYEFRIVGSNDGGTTWTTADLQSGVSTTVANQANTFNCSTNNSSYSRYRIIITRVNPGGWTFASIAEWRLYV